MQNRKTSAMLLLAAMLVTSGCAAGPEARNKEVARRVVTEILSGGNFELANELYAPGFVNHGQTRDVDLAEDQAAARGWKAAFPDLVMTTDKLVAEGDLVTVLWSARGTNTGTGNGLPATGKALTGRGITIWRIVDGPHYRRVVRVRPALDHATARPDSAARAVATASGEDHRRVDEKRRSPSGRNRERVDEPFRAVERRQDLLRWTLAS